MVGETKNSEGCLWLETKNFEAVHDHWSASMNRSALYYRVYSVESTSSTPERPLPYNGALQTMICKHYLFSQNTQSRFFCGERDSPCSDANLVAI